MMIRVAVREGGPNPEFNVPLANILEQCRSKNMPKASVETAIKGVSKPGSECTYEARGPGGCMMLIEILTDNKTRSHQEIKHLLRKNGGLLADVRHNFSRKGVVVVAQGLTTERALELAIEAGAEDVQEIEDEEEKPVLQFICDATELKKFRDSLEDLGTQVVSAGLAFVPQTPTPLDQVQLEAASVLIDALLDRSDVIRVWDDIRAQS
ncbi:translational activator of cytochrome c oxidase 1 [Diretmus argenteus]